MNLVDDDWAFPTFVDEGNDPAAWGEWTGPPPTEYSGPMPTKTVEHQDLGAIDGSAYPPLHLCTCQQYVPEDLMAEHLKGTPVL